MIRLNSPIKRQIIFLNGQRGLDALSYLISKGHHISAVVTPINFYNKNLDDLLIGSEIIKLSFNNINSQESLEVLSRINSDLFIVAGYSSILSKNLLRLPRFGCLNLHAGRLPQYRGGSPLNWQIINGEKNIGLSVIALDERIDSGPIYSELLFKYEEGETIADLHLKVNKLFPLILEEAINKIKNKVSPSKQDENLAQYWHQRSDQDGKLQFDQMAAKKVINFINALTRPYGGAWAKYNNKFVRIFSAKIFDTVVKGCPGRICYLLGQGPLVICYDRAVLLTDYVIEDGSKLKHGDYLE